MFQAFPVKNPTFGDAPLPNVPGDGTQQVPPPYGTADNAPRLMPAMNFADPSMSPNMNMNMPPNMNMSMNMTTNMSPDVAANMAAATMTAMASMMNQFVPTSFAVPTNQPVFAEQFCVQNATGMELVVLPVNQQAQVNCLCAFDVLGQMWFRSDAAENGQTGKRQLLDASGTVLATIKQKAFSFHDSWIIYRGDHAETNCYGGDITDASWRLYKFSPDEDSIDIRMNTSQDIIFDVTGNLYQRNYTIKEVSTGRILAECSQQSRSTAPPSAYVQSITPLKKYFVHVQPGVDLAFVASAVLMVEELYAEGGDVTVIGGGGGGGGRRRGRGGLSWHGNTRHNRGRLTHNSKPKRASHSKSHRSGGSRGRRGGRR